MNPQLSFEIAALVLSLIHGHDAIIADTLVKIAQKAAQAYQQETGRVLDPSLIRAEGSI